jgi:hypothetical protein
LYCPGDAVLCLHAPMSSSTRHALPPPPPFLTLTSDPCGVSRLGSVILFSFFFPLPLPLLNSRVWYFFFLTLLLYETHRCAVETTFTCLSFPLLSSQPPVSSGPLAPPLFAFPPFLSQYYLVLFSVCVELSFFRARVHALSVTDTHVFVLFPLFVARVGVCVLCVGVWVCGCGCV